jgi:hypothetical protein
LPFDRAPLLGYAHEKARESAKSTQAVIRENDLSSRSSPGLARAFLYEVALHVLSTNALRQDKSRVA